MAKIAEKIAEIIPLYLDLLSPVYIVHKTFQKMKIILLILP